MGPKRKRSSSARASTRKRSSTKKLPPSESSDDKSTTNSKNRKDSKKRTSKTEGSEEVQYDPVHQGSTRQARGKITKVLTGAKVNQLFFSDSFLNNIYFRNLIHQPRKFAMLLKMIIQEKKQVRFLYVQFHSINFLFSFDSLWST